MAFENMKPQQLISIGVTIKRAFVKFTEETGLDLKAICEKLEKSHGYTHKNLQKWFPKTINKGEDTNTSLVLNNVLTRLKTILQAGGYELVDEKKNLLTSGQRTCLIMIRSRKNSGIEK